MGVWGSEFKVEVSGWGLGFGVLGLRLKCQFRGVGFGVRFMIKQWYDCQMALQLDASIWRPAGTWCFHSGLAMSA